MPGTLKLRSPAHHSQKYWSGNLLRKEQELKGAAELTKWLIKVRLEHHLIALQTLGVESLKDVIDVTAEDVEEFMVKKVEQNRFAREKEKLSTFTFAKETDTVWTTWKVNVGMLSDNAKLLLQLASFIGPEQKPVEFAKMVLGEMDRGEDGEEVHGLLRELARFSLIEWNSNDDALFSMHRLVQQVQLDVILLDDAELETTEATTSERMA